MNVQINVIVPEFFELDRLEVMKINLNPNNPNVALVIVGDNLNNNLNTKPTVRYYLAKSTKDIYKVIKELDAFVFNSKEEAIDFVNNETNYHALQFEEENVRDNNLIFT